MDEESKSRRAAWRARARADLRRPRTWIILASLYVATFLLVASVPNLIVPHLPWISKPYVNPDPPPLVTAFYSANLVLAGTFIAGLLAYCFGDPANMTKWKKR
jgi:hypothetical protein